MVVSGLMKNCAGDDMGGDFNKSDDDEFLNAAEARSDSDASARRRAEAIISEMLQDIRDAISDNQRHIRFYVEFTKNDTTDGIVLCIVQQRFMDKGYSFRQCECCTCCDEEECIDDDCILESEHYCVSWDE